MNTRNLRPLHSPNASSTDIIDALTTDDETVNIIKEIQTKNHDVLLVTYPGMIQESCIQLCAFFQALRDGVILRNESGMTATRSETTTGPRNGFSFLFSEQVPSLSSLKSSSSSSSFVVEEQSSESSGIKASVLLPLRATNVMRSTKVIFIGRGSNQQFLAFRNEIRLSSMMKQNDSKQSPSDMDSKHCHMTTPSGNNNPSYILPKRQRSKHKKVCPFETNQRKYPTPTTTSSKKSSSSNYEQQTAKSDLETTSWFCFRKDNNSLICHRMGATIPSCYWEEDPSIIPTVSLVSMNRTLIPIFIGKNGTGRLTTSSSSSSSGGILFGNDNANESLFPCWDIVERLLESRVKRAEIICNWLSYAKKEFSILEACVFDDMKHIQKEDTFISHTPLPTDVMSLIFDYLDNKSDTSNMKLVSKSAFRTTNKITVNRLRILLNKVESILPKAALGFDDQPSLLVDNEQEEEQFTIPESSSRDCFRSTRCSSSFTSNIDLRRRRTVSSDSMTYSSISDVSDCIDDWDGNGMTMKSLNTTRLQDNNDLMQKNLWVGWNDCMSTSVYAANSLLEKCKVFLEKNDSRKVSLKNKSLVSVEENRRFMFSLL